MDTTKALLICLLLLPAIAFAHGGSHPILIAQSESAETTIQSAEEFKQLVLRTQYALNQLGYGVGKPDGVLSEKTVKAIKLFQVENEIVVDGEPSEVLLEALLRKVRG